MVDVHSSDVRRKNMQAIRGKDTKPELLIRRALFKLGYRYQLHRKDLPGKPDIVFPKYCAVIFVNGCFWHMHHCNQFRLPATRTEWWENKLTANRKRDLNALAELRASGWRVLLIWECAIKGRNRLPEEALISEISSWIREGSVYDEFPKTESCRKVIKLDTGTVCKQYSTATRILAKKIKMDTNYDQPRKFNLNLQILSNKDGYCNSTI